MTGCHRAGRLMAADEKQHNAPMRQAPNTRPLHKYVLHDVPRDALVRMRACFAFALRGNRPAWRTARVEALLLEYNGAGVLIC